MSDEESEEEFQLPFSDTESVFIQLHQEYLFAQSAGFTQEQAFKLVRDLYATRLQYSLNEHEEENES